MNFNYKILFILLFVFAQGCGNREEGWNIPLLYKLEIQQGNVVSQSMLNKLKVGMSQEKVTLVMGTPLIIDPFHSSRWEYVFTYNDRKKTKERRRITLHFKDKKLTHISGDVQISLPAGDADTVN